jgi:hypothetical protein
MFGAGHRFAIGDHPGGGAEVSLAIPLRTYPGREEETCAFEP